MNENTKQLNDFVESLQTLLRYQLKDCRVPLDAGYQNRLEQCGNDKSFTLNSRGQAPNNNNLSFEDNYPVVCLIDIPLYTSMTEENKQVLQDRLVVAAQGIAKEIDRNLEAFQYSGRLKPVLRSNLDIFTNSDLRRLRFEVVLLVQLVCEPQPLGS